MRKSALPFNLELHGGAENPTLRTPVERLTPTRVFMVKKQVYFPFGSSERKQNKQSGNPPGRSHGPTFVPAQSTEVISQCTDLPEVLRSHSVVFFI